MASNFEEQRSSEYQSDLKSACPGCQYGGQFSHWGHCPNHPVNQWGQGGIGGGLSPYQDKIINFPPPKADPGKQKQLSDFIKKFDSGATRSSDEGKNHYDGFLSIPALEEFGDYMTRHRVQPDGGLREPDNWQKGIPIASYVGSLFRHTIELVGLMRGHVSRRLKKEYPGKDINFLKRETACACWFNVQGFIHELLKTQGESTAKLVNINCGTGTVVQRTGDSTI